MKILLRKWRGVAKLPFANYAKSMICQNNPSIAYFLETRLAENWLPIIKHFMSPPWEVYMIPAMGLSDGIVIGWHRCNNNDRWQASSYIKSLIHLVVTQAILADQNSVLTQLVTEIKIEESPAEMHPDIYLLVLMGSWFFL